MPNNLKKCKKIQQLFLKIPPNFSKKYQQIFKKRAKISRKYLKNNQKYFQYILIKY